MLCLFGLQWHALSREEQAKYYELARKERQLHMQLYPGWSARDNYVSCFLEGSFRSNFLPLTGVFPFSFLTCNLCKALIGGMVSKHKSGICLHFRHLEILRCC